MVMPVIWRFSKGELEREINKSRMDKEISPDYVVQLFQCARNTRFFLKYGIYL